MKYSIPVTQGTLSMHFGHCEQFAIFEVEGRKIVSCEMVTPPPHQPGLLPPWLAERGVKVVIAGGMGQRALDLFKEAGIAVTVGAPAEDPEKVLEMHLNGNLIAGGNVCNHDEQHECH
mgnify:CR=1 FL=1